MEICCGDFAFWTSWNWENPSCQSACNRGRGKLYRHNCGLEMLKSSQRFSSPLPASWLLSLYLLMRIHVDAENRMKILRIILNREKLESDFQFDKLANATEGYSGSDLKVMHYWLLLISNLSFFEENIWP
uniref:AAA ATPase AAA+ lid domain-containing protein n=1 Tax=Salix viminalis TaxID=40686 RepID=A0A6N2L963_SALVM